jgi:hypothetical protein
MSTRRFSAERTLRNLPLYLSIEDEAVLARLDPVERAIMETFAYTMTGLSVKARHLAYGLPEYWEGPTGQMEAQPPIPTFASGVDLMKASHFPAQP